MGQVERVTEEAIKIIDYNRIASSDAFVQLLSNKKRFIISYTFFYMVYSLILPILAFYTSILNHKVVGDLTWAWVYAFSFIPVSLCVCSAYVKKAAHFDDQVKVILEKEGL